ncbi:bifunctional riboflavin kinase/FAD synthetase [Parafrigoribacterium mesophilum]|uniref:bifunctional riboflavin kinase/FAD synthetase n=1 Tax=Parafrigoribacterium mesophilum TaxID=433646 RepID=UPI0031FC9A1B
MLFVTSLSDVPADFGPSAVTIGKFDGLHTGHRSVLQAVRDAAQDAGLTSTVLTFDRNPLSVLAPERAPDPLVSNEQKRELLADAGIAATVMLHFDRAFSTQSPQQFVQRILVDALHARIVFVGADFRFGAGGAGSVALLQQLGPTLGFQVTVVEAMSLDGTHRVSATRIRQLLADGDVAGAAHLLGRPHAVRGTVIRGEQRGRTLGFPTANLSPKLEGFIPADGVYAGLLTVDGQQLPAAISVGNNPTFDGVPERQVEAHVLDRDLDLYDKTVEVSFVSRIRGMKKFAGIDALVAQIGRDVSQVRALLLGDAPHGATR